MDYKEFSQRICNIVADRLGEEYQVELKERRKNNGVKAQGLAIKHRDQKISFIIYLNIYWENYASGMTFQKVVDMVIAICQNTEQDCSFNGAFYQSFEKVKDRICYRLIGREANREWLEDIPHIDFLDLAICFYYEFQTEKLGEVAVQINNMLMEMWETKTEELFELAKINTPRLFPWVCRDIRDILFEDVGTESGTLDGSEEDILQDDMFEFQVLTNQQRKNGAICILYPEVHAMLAEKGYNYCILPSSIHECILVRCVGNPEVDEYKTIVEDVNRTQLAVEEVLSDSVYFYDATEREIRLLG